MKNKPDGILDELIALFLYCACVAVCYPLAYYYGAKDVLSSFFKRVSES